ncbi:MAG: hypothetical protein EOO01_23640 [Chitinophagaceae bacterium]|nr:MAG: hypothetical protein EOO01_23640 [Chitinophagaceae bacterium]
MYPILSNLLRKRKPEPATTIHGHEFENHMISLFNRKHFKLLAWRSVLKSSAEVYDNTQSYPDLEFQFADTRKYRFSLKCVWHEDFRDDKVSWSDPDIIRRYLQYQELHAVPMYVAIGIGGTPPNPEKLFVTLLDKLSLQSEINRAELSRYQRKPEHKFRYDVNRRELV